MRNIFRRDTQADAETLLTAEKKGWFSRIIHSRFLPIVGIALVVLVTVGIFLYRDRFAEMGMLGYPGVFLVSMVWNSTVLVPIPSFWTYFLLGTVFHPALVGLAGGGGAAIGEMTSYLAGYSGRAILSGKHVKTYARVEQWINKRGIWVIFAFNLVPVFPFDLVGIAAGASRYPLWKFYLACLAGRSLSYGIIAYLGCQGWIPPLPFLNPPP